MFAPRLKRALDVLSTSPIEFNEQGKYFQLRLPNGALRAKKGLTGILAREFAIANEAADAGIADDDAPPRKKARRSRNDPEPQPVVWRRPLTAVRTTMSIRCAASCTAAALAAGVPRNNTYGDWFNRWHGSEVDRLLRLYVQMGSRERFVATFDNVDPCVGTLIDYFDAHGEAIVASQVPLYSDELNIATSLDVLLTDRATRSQLCVYEVKASQSSDDRGYVKLRDRKRVGASRGQAISYHNTHQVQLWCQHHMLTKRLGEPPDAAAVLRVSPGLVRKYPLSTYYHERAQKLLRSLRQKGAKKAPRAPRKHRAFACAPRQTHAIELE